MGQRRGAIPRILTAGFEVWRISPTARSLAARLGIRAVQPVTTTDPQAAFGAVVVESRTDRPNIAKTALEARARGSAGRAARPASAGVVAAGSSGRPAPLVAAAAERSGRPPNARPLRAAHNMPFGGSRAAGTRVPAGADRICAASTVLLERAAAIASLPGVSAACAVELRGRRERRSGLHQLHVLLCVVARQHVAAADLWRRARRRVDRHARRGDAHGDQVHGERRLRATR